MLYALEANYVRWHAGLAETNSVMRVNGGSVYALGKVKAAGVTLPIGMYVMPMRGTVGALR